jgi:hypothetical protein
MYPHRDPKLSFVPFSLLNMILIACNVLSLYKYKLHINLFTFLYPLYSPSHCYPHVTGPALHSCPLLFRCIVIVQRSFTVAFHLWTQYTFMGLTPYYSPFPFLLSLLFSSFQCVSLCLFLNTCNELQYSSLLSLSLNKAYVLNFDAEYCGVWVSP